MSPKIVTYSFYTLTPAEADCVRWALRKWEEALGGRWKAVEGFNLSNHISFEKSPMDNRPQFIAYCQPNAVGHLITFKSKVKWATSWWQREFTQRQCMRRIALHEIGHALGLGHSDRKASIMHPKPSITFIDKESRWEALKRVAG